MSKKTDIYNPRGESPRGTNPVDILIGSVLLVTTALAD